MMALNESVVMMMTAGIDMFMLPSQLEMSKYIDSVKQAITNEALTIERLNDAVAKVLSVKLALGVVERGWIQQDEGVTENKQIHRTTEYEDSLSAVHESLVLLKNDKKLVPLDSA
jgi:beta-glucosidase